MPKKIKPLSAVEVKRLARIDGMHAVGDPAGLLLQVRGNATSWILRTMVGAKRRSIGLGGFPDVSLADARAAAKAQAEKIRAGVDPIAEKRAASLAAARMLTFDECARRMIDSRSSEWRNAKHRAQWVATLETYASPVIGNMPVAQVDIPDVMRVLEPIWATKTETASRVRGRIEAVLAWATVSKLRSGDNPARWTHNLDKLLPKPTKVRKVRHHKALPADAMPAFMASLRSRNGMAARALEFAILTAARSGEVRGATWNEIDLDAATWTVPADRMKAGKAHTVPLSTPAVKLLRALPHFADTPLVFPAVRGGMLSDMALAVPLKAMKAKAVPHGFRSTFRDWVAERTAYPRDVAEMALAHTIGDKVEAAYRRGDLLAKRTKMMADWGRFIGTLPATDNVTQIRRKRA